MHRGTEGLFDQDALEDAILVAGGLPYRQLMEANHNGVTDANELKTLASLGITAIDLNYQEKGGQLFGGNKLQYRT